MDAEGTYGKWLLTTLQERRRAMHTGCQVGCMLNADGTCGKWVFDDAAGSEKNDAYGMRSALAESGFWWRCWSE